MSETTSYKYQAWPSYRYGPDGQSGIFECAEDVPSGWTTLPNGEPEQAVQKPTKARGNLKIDKQEDF